MKKLFALVLAFTLALCLPLAVALAAEQRVFDDAMLFSDDETAALEQRIAELRAALEVDVGVLTADFGVRSTREYADAFYEERGMGAGANRSGILFFLDMDNRESYISTAGDLIDYIDDDREEAIFDAQMDYLADGDFASAMLVSLDLVEEYLRAGLSSGHYAYDEATGELLDPGSYGSSVEYTPYEEHDAPPNYLLGALVSLGVGALAGGVATLIVRGGYKKAYKPVEFAKRRMSTLALHRNDTTLANQFVTTRVIPRTPPPSSGSRPGGFGGGGSGVHTSSGGMSHGGGGRRF